MTNGVRWQKERLTRSVRRVAGRYGPVARATLVCKHSFIVLFRPVSVDSGVLVAGPAPEPQTRRGDEYIRAPMGKASPQSACSAGKRSRSATPSTTGGACGTQTQRSIQSLGHALSPSGLDGGSPASAASVAGFGKTGLLAANGSVTFPAFIFKNALAANIRKGSRLKVSGFRWQAANAQLFAQAREA
jgi:hypothetical protein